ncbi:protein-disulfide reductase DsbD [Kingella kingae]|uniref:Thiol:disulfide interchange protein DsbD n=2 Tax=Kingella kingae TaxID=504 RepID=F5S959_KINKI|nr:protein-disulfide reductase DsbD [Kingella kingae]EGK07606.1 thiol:disulfide interchange protein DsbD [Kingella kingae ATCC 23330]MDK4535094.1 protein-disulfide reductase DsbD [Kingella kingae]MDK4541613.1 protein-disulfide reductase DsbD [Kingella kingae]MDK4554122.1 protein-disulfide reductase DsbD [Kingella kingae]UOP02999.1 protein-disulfide reductase DsbD [Kingella kingae]
MNKLIAILGASLISVQLAHAAVNPDDLLPAEQAFAPTVQVSDQGVQVQFKIADGYYLYQSKITAQTEPENLLGAPQLSAGKEKEDEFFGKQTVYYHNADVRWNYAQTVSQPYKIHLRYQGCADVGICYPPVDTSFDINGNGTYGNEINQANDAKSLFVKKPAGAAPTAPVAPPSSAVADDSLSGQLKSSLHTLSRDTLGWNILAFFIFGLGLSFTACMYPLLPIVSSIIVGDQSNTPNKKRAFMLSLVYVQGLALTYTSVGVLAGLTGALLTVWLQQPIVVLSMSGVMILLALSMFGLFNLQLPSSLQAYFQNKSNKLSGGKTTSVFVMGMLSALIVGPCVAPPLAAALGYIGKTGDALLGGTLLYALALGTGVPLIIIGTFGGHIMPRAGVWMNGIKYAFGVILLAVAVYLATPFLPYAATASLYTLLLIAPAVFWLTRLRGLKSSLHAFSIAASALLLIGGAWFGIQSARSQETALHRFLTLHPQGESHGQKFSDVAQMEQAIAALHAQNSNQPVLLDFYADWCVSCKEMEARTFSDSQVQAAVPMARLIQIDVTENTAAHQALLKQYGLFGPPGLFVLKADGSRSDPLLGYAKSDEFIAWYQARQ